MTSTTATPRRPLPGWLTIGLLAALVFVLCWGSAIAWWHTADSEPGAGDLIMMLLALPCGLLLAIGLGKKFVLSRRAAPAAVAGAAAAPAPAPATAAAAPLAILAAALRSPHGASVDELAAALAADKARPDLDPELVDDDGFPITSARSTDAVDEAVQEEITEWLHHNGMAELRFSEAQWRALVLGTLVARDLAAHAVSELMSLDNAATTLRLIPVLPSGWTVEQRSAVTMWFRHAVTQFGWSVAAIVATELAVSGPAATSALLTRFLGQFALDSRTAKTRLAALVVACESHLDQERIDEWAANGSLFTPARPQGLVPGEGAAGLLLTSLHGAHSVDGGPLAQLHPLLEARREASLDHVKRVEPKLLTGLSERVLQAASLDLSRVAAIAADTGQRTSREMELMGLASSALPQLEGTLDVARAGLPFGSCGAVPFIAALGLARHHALAADAPVLFVSNDDPLSCCTALVCPPAAAAAAPVTA